MADTERLINKEQGDSIISAIQGITARLQEMYTVDDAMSSSSENPVQNKVITAALDNKVDKVEGKGLSTNDYTNEEKASVANSAEQLESTQTASGNPITLTDCAPINAESLVVELEPKQDLHGQSAPYVGGAGKNKVDYLSCVGIGARDGTDSVYASGTTSISGDNLSINYGYGNNGGILKGIKGISVNSGEYVTISFDVVSLTGSSVFAVGIGDYNGGGTNNVKDNISPSNNKVSVTLDAKSNYSKLGVFIQPTNANSSAVIKNVQVELGQTATSYAPYSNICPITGYTECEVKTLTDIQSYYDIQTIVRSGKAQDVFNIGDEIPVKYTATNGTQYDMPFRVVAFQNVELQDGTTKQGMFLQSVYATLEGVQFDHPENEKVTEETYQDDLTYYVPNGDRYTRLVKGTDYQVGDTITNRDTVHSAINDSSINICRYGYNRWKHSAIRQWLNSDKAAGQWWTAQHTGDVAPDQLNSVRGFLAGLPAEFVEVLGKPKMTQVLNTVSEPDKTLTEEDTYDKMFLASLEQMYSTPQVGSGKEGTYFDYWKRALGLTSPSSWYPTTYEAYKTYALENHNSAQTVRLRSANRGYSCDAWDVYSGGNVSSYYGANSALRSAPVCVIC